MSADMVERQDDTFISRYARNSKMIPFPVALFEHPGLKGLSQEALFLYGMLYVIQESGMELDEEGAKCIHVTQKEIAQVFRCGMSRAKRIYIELRDAGLIYVAKHASGHTTMYVNAPQ